MGMNSKRNPKKVAEDQWASDETNQPLLPFKKSPGRPRKNKHEEKRNVQLRLPISLLEEIDSLLDGESRHSWIIRSIKNSIRKS